jgi:tetratricopeptide (TPR) repeat protein
MSCKLKALEMWVSGTERARAERYSLMGRGVLIVLASALFLASQTATSQVSTDVPPSALPKSCLEESHPSVKISELLDVVHNHPTAGAYNTLGVLYAQSNHLSCAISAFEVALKLNDQDWEAHYNLALAFLRKGDRGRAVRELQAAIQQKPDSVSSHFALGTAWEDAKKLDEAEEQFRAVVKIDPHFAPGSIKLSEVLIAEGKFQAAVGFLEDANGTAPASAQDESLRVALSVAYVANGEIEKAFTTLKNLVATQPGSANAHFNLGLLYARRNQVQGAPDEEAAVLEFREALERDPSMDDARLALGKVLISLRKYSDAMPILLEYTHRQPKDAQGFYALGLAYRGINDSLASLAAFQRATVLNPKDPAIHFDFGMLLAAAGKPEVAIQQLEAAERINPSDIEISKELAFLFEKTGHRERARVEQGKVAALKSGDEKDSAIAKLSEKGGKDLEAGDAKAAVQSYRQAVELNPDNAKLRFNLSLALGRLEDFSSERKELERAVELDPSLAVAQNQLGMLALRNGQQGEAERRFKKTLAIDPSFSEAQSNLGVLYNRQGKNAEAASLFQKAIQSDPKNTKAYVNLGLVMAQQGAFAVAEQQFRAAIGVDAKYADAYAALGMLQAKTGRAAEAVKSFQQAVGLEPSAAQAHLNLGIALVDQFDRPGGLKEFFEAARLDPNLASAHYNLGRFFFETGKYEDAARELETAIRLQPDNAGALYFLALTSKQENQVERSAALLEKVVALQPDNADAQYLLGQNMEHAGDSRAAIQHWKAAVRADPNHAQALYNLAKSLNKINDPEAKQYQERFDALQKSQQIADRVSELGNFALEAANAQNWPQAVEQMNEAIQLCGDCPQGAHLHKNLGLFYGRTGNIDQATKELRTALQLAPNDIDARNALAMLERAHPEERVK